MRPGRDHGLVEIERRSVVELDRVPDRIESYSPAPESQVEVEPVDRARSDERDPGFVPLTGEELLRQRWSVVWGMLLFSDDDDAAREALVAERSCRAHP